MPPSLRPVPVRDPAQQALALFGLVSLVFTMATETVSFALAGAATSPATVPGLVALLASQVLSGVALLVRRYHRLVPWLLLGLLVGGLAQVLRAAGDFPAVDLLVPGYWLVGPMVVSLRAARRRQYLGFIAAAALSLVALQVVTVGLSSRTDVADVLWIVQPAVEVALFGDAMIAIARARERAVAREIDARRDEQEATAAAGARREAARLLHDHVLHALGALGGAASLDEGAVVTECREAHEAMTQHLDAAGTERVEELVAADPALARVGAVLSGRATPLPAAVARSMAAAVHEALGNVERHAQASSVTVRVARRRDAVTVTVTDDGRGFDPSRRPADRMGVGRSIHERLDDVGGLATITSAPGQGTRVELAWPATGDEGTVASWQQAPQRVVRRALTRTAWPMLVTALLMTLVIGPTVVDSPLVVAASLLALGLGCAAAAVLTRRALRRVEVVVLLGLSVVVWALNLWAVPEVPELDYPLWMGWGISSLVHLVVLSRRWTSSLAVAVGWVLVQAGGLLVAYRDPVVLWDHSFLLTSGSGDVLLTLLVLLVMLHAAQGEAAAAWAASRLRAATAQLVAREHLERFWSRRVTAEALPLLARVADGTLSPADAEVQARARLLEPVLRDELLLGPAHHRLAGTLGAVRQAGWRVSSSLSQADGTAPLAAAAVLLEQLGPPVAPSQPVTASASPRCAVLVALGAGAAQVDAWCRHLEPLGGRVDADGEFVRMVLPVDAAGAAPGERVPT